MKTMKLIGIATLAIASAGVGAETAMPASNWAALVNAGNPAALASLYTDNAVLVSPGTEIVSSPADISRYWAAKREAGASDFRIIVVNERVEGDLRYQSAVWSTRFSSNGVVSGLEGQMTNVLVRQPDGGWKIQMQSWN